jgi:hypothetical protein
MLLQFSPKSKMEIDTFKNKYYIATFQMDNNDEINNIIEQLKSDSVVSETKTKQIENTEPVSDDNVDTFVYGKTVELVNASLGAVQTIRDSVLTGVDPKEISALSQLINATTKALDTLNQINLQNKKSKTNVEIKKMELEANKMIASKIPQTTNILIASRDEILKGMSEKKSLIKDTDIIEIED